MTCLKRNDDGSHRDPDDWQPRAQLKCLFNSSVITLNDTDAIKEYATKFAVDEKYMRSHLSSQGQKDYPIFFFKSTKTLHKLYNLRTKRLPKMTFASKANSAKDPVEKHPSFMIV